MKPVTSRRGEGAGHVTTGRGSRSRHDGDREPVTSRRGEGAGHVTTGRGSRSRHDGERESVTSRRGEGAGHVTTGRGSRSHHDGEREPVTSRRGEGAGRFAGRLLVWSQIEVSRLSTLPLGARGGLWPLILTLAGIILLLSVCKLIPNLTPIGKTDPPAP